jgi:energy-coupling factor transporter ATP-binding protein EcfA2
MRQNDRKQETAMKLPTAKSAPVRDLSKKSMLLYGPPGIGKSTFASQAEGAIFLECEPGLSELEVYKVPITNWKDMEEAVNLLATTKHDFRTIVVDTIDNAFKYCEDSICEKKRVEYVGDMDHGKGWALVKNEWHRWCLKLCNLGFGVIMISHSQTKEIDTRTGKRTVAQPTIPDRARGVVDGIVDMILFAEVIEIIDANKKKQEVRVIRTKPSLTYEAKDRSQFLPDTMYLDYARFYNAYNGITEGESHE